MDATTATFERDVIEASRALPVVVDFWAPWCGPCRSLGPVIEKVAAELDGHLKLVKVNSDENPELSAAYGIRSIPSVIAFKDGRPVAQFLGALPEGQVREFMRKLLPSPSELALQQAETAFAAHRLDEAEQALARVKREPGLEARIEAVRQGIAYARAGLEGPSEDELLDQLGADPDDHESRLKLAALYAAEHRYAQAMETLLEVVRRARDWRDGEARKQLLALFTLASAEPQLVAEYRRKLANALH
ncbi:MAG TPA: thioredoxin [Gammaproteobacteria bacterium]|nr:thioredoxin [Gammaproteobacteria bacterium]